MTKSRQAPSRYSAHSAPPELMGTLRMRRAVSNDFAALLALEEASFSGDKLSARRIRHWISARNAILLVAANGNNIVGACLVLRRTDSKAARLYSIAIAQAARGQGLGGKLLRKAESIARTEGSATMRLEVAANNEAAVALYQKVGYREFGRKPAYYEDGQDALRMEKPL